MKGLNSILLILLVLALTPVCLSQTAKGVGNLSIDKLPSKEKRWALIIGVNNYGLKGAVNDAKALKDTLIKYAGFPENQIILLTTDDPNSPPSRTNIIRELDKIARSVPPDGFFLFAFSGHGKTIDKNAYMIPSDGFFTENEEILGEVSINVEKIRKAVERSKVKQVLMLIDSCRDRIEDGKKGAETERLTVAMTGGFSFEETNKSVEAFVTLFATRLGESAYEYFDRETGQYRGYFSKAVEEALSGKAANEKGEVTLASLVKYVEDTVPVRSYKNGGREQIPLKNTNNGFKENELVLSVNKKSALDLRAFSGVLPFIPIPEINIERAAKITQVGDELLNKDDIKPALSNFNEAITLNPDFDYAYAKRGECYRLLGNLSQAFTDLNEAIRKNPRNDFAYLSRAAAYQDSGENDLAFKDLNESIRLNNDNVWAFHNRGNLYVQIKNCRQALIDLTKAISIRPRSVRGYLSRSDAYLCTEDTNSALNDLNTALEIDSGHKDTLLKRVWLLTKLGRFEGVRADYGKLIEIDPPEAEGYSFMRAMIGFRQMAAAFQDAKSGKFGVTFPNVFAEFTKIIELNGKLKAVSYSLRGMTYALEGNMNAAKKDLDMAVLVGQNDSIDLAFAYFLRSFYHVQLKKYKYAQADVDSISKLDFGSDEMKKNGALMFVHVCRSAIFSAKGSNKDALTEINSAITLFPGVAFMYQIRAEIYYALKRFDEAKADRAKAEEGGDDGW